MRSTKPSPRQVLSENLRSLMAARPGLDTIKKIAEASGSTLSNGKVGRIYAASHTTDVDTLQHLADVFGLEPWQLLVEDLDPKALPRLADAAVLGEILDAVKSVADAKAQNEGIGLQPAEAARQTLKAASSIGMRKRPPKRNAA